MMDQVVLGGEFFEHLTRCEEQIAGSVRAARCPHCGGPLHRSDYDRKPRGGVIAPEGETSVRRISLCCGRESCRKRATPPSLRFLGRRVYLGAVVIVASILARMTVTASELRRKTGVPTRTTRRWVEFWQGAFLSTEVWTALRARLLDVDVDELPTSIARRLASTTEQQVSGLLVWLAPLTTVSVTDGSRFLRGTL